MITCILEKHIGSGKMFVSQWWFTPKSKVKETMYKFPEAVIIDPSEIPESFYENSSQFYYEAGQLINSRGLIKK